MSSTAGASGRSPRVVGAVAVDGLLRMVRGMRTPPPADVPFVVAGAGVWIGVGVVSLAFARPAMAAVLGAVLLAVGIAGIGSGRGRQRLGVVLVAACCAGIVAGLVAEHARAAVHHAAVPPGTSRVVGVVVTDPVVERFGTAVVIDVSAVDNDGGDPMRVESMRLVWRSSRLDVAVGDVVDIGRAVVRHRPGGHRGTPVTGTVRGEGTVVGRHQRAHLVAGEALRRRVLAALSVRNSQAEALTTGFLIGDISELGAIEREELRRSGLTHFVAVSGGNVALYLAGLWLLVMPLRLSPEIRSALGLAALVVFVVATRWEPSVLRAAAMAGVVMAGRILGWPVDPWRALGGGVAVVLLFAPHLAGAAGFHLSVAATSGLLLGSGRVPDRRPRWLWAALTASVAAQLAVMPLLLVYFDTVPLLAPLANVVAAPVVSASTVVAGIGALSGIDVLVDAGVGLAGWVLRIAGVASLGPQLSAVGVASATATGALIVTRAWRPIGVALAMSAMLVVPLGPASLSPDTVAVLDVGQGDAIVVRGADGSTVGVDTGSDPVRYQQALRRVGVTRLDLLVITHGDADHIGGVAGLFDRVDVGTVWVPGMGTEADSVRELRRDAAAAAIPVRSPVPGARIHAGGIVVDVLGPKRRYDAENDGSLVLWLTGPARTMLLAGDIEAVAQRELPPLRPDVLLVPHHGSATTDETWLAATVGGLAIISVGANTYGHPASSILGVLEEAGATVVTTSDHGDVVVPLGEG